MKVRDSWSRIRRWTRSLAPESLQWLAGPASAADLEALRERFGPLPADVRGSLALHDGTGELGPLPVRLLSAEEMLATHRMLCAHHSNPPVFFGAPPIDSAIRPKWWHDRWLPVATNNVGDYLLADLDPAPGGRFGQLISLPQARPDRRLKAPSFAEWVARVADRMERGEIVATEDHGRFFGVIERQDCCGALADLTLRGEPSHAASDRRSAASRQPAQLADALVERLQRAGKLQFSPGAFVPLALIPLADALESGLHPAAIHRTLACAPGVHELAAGPDDIADLLDQLVS